MPGREDWLALAEQEDPDDIRERILTGYKNGKPFTPYVPTVPLPRVRSALDFGCGLGRNFPYLKQIAGSVAGFDLPPMIQRCRETASEVIDLLTSDWEQLRVLHFDLIVASLVLQHIEPQPARLFLRDFSTMAPVVYLLTRTMTDFSERMLEVVAETELFDATDCVEVDHDPVTHQLKVLRTVTFDEARAGRNDTHFELLLHVRTRGGRGARDEINTGARGRGVLPGAEASDRS
jgi:SAM-dependent methyltransferase